MKTVDSGDRNETAVEKTVGRSRLSVSPFRLPIDAARRKAREVIGQNPRDGLTPTVENWRQLPDGEIEFGIRYFPTAD
jgi:hypothetical protein